MAPDLAVALWGAVTVPATLTQQPDARIDFAAYADYVTTTRFLVGHLVGSIAGTVLGILGIVGLTVILARTRVARAALTAATVAIVGCGLLLPVFGVAAFAQPAIGNAAHAGLAGGATDRHRRPRNPDPHSWFRRCARVHHRPGLARNRCCPI